MIKIIKTLLLFIVVGIITWLISFTVEWTRTEPNPPGQLRWAPEISNSYTNVGGTKLRYIKTGQGPVLLLLHTLRTQLDLFEKVIPELSKDFTVYALDYPGHGFSEIPDGNYDADFFVQYVEGFIESMGLEDVTLAGVSIGASISLLVASNQNPHVTRVVAINPYDYHQGKGMARSSFLGGMITHTSKIPFIGETVMRLRNFVIMKQVLRGGVADPNSLSLELAKEMYRVGDRKQHYRAFLSLLRNANSWDAANERYVNIKVPVLLVWGSHDWSTLEEREYDESLISNVKTLTVENGGHFLPLDQPGEVIKLIKMFN